MPPVFTCCVVNCDADAKNTRKHRFPKDPVLFRNLIEFSQRTDLENMDVEKVRNNYRICNYHFVPEYMVDGVQHFSISGLVTGAIPTLNSSSYVELDNNALIMQDETVNLTTESISSPRPQFLDFIVYVVKFAMMYNLQISHQKGEVLLAVLLAQKIKITESLGHNAWWGARLLISLVEFQSRNILRLISFTEIVLMPLCVILVLTGKAGLLTPFIYYHFLVQRYTSRRNPYTRNMFHELRILLESTAHKPNMPAIISNVLLAIVNFATKLAPPQIPVPPSPTSSQ
ncbi:hypothetical protein FQR65_LT10144 [Abscondita terminalis]|nr:hypothetical protein FQR65_LT10144 [Abscondita terminalis]